jgi:hypothetical protein
VSSGEEIVSPLHCIIIYLSFSLSFSLFYSDDCQFYQGETRHTLWPEDMIIVPKGSNNLTMFNKYGITERYMCKTCATYIGGRALRFNMFGIPMDRFVGIPENSPSFGTDIAMHVQYRYRKTDLFADGVTKFNDFPSAFGGSGTILDDHGNTIGSDK